MLSNPSIGGSCTGPGITMNTQGKYLSGQCCGALKDTKEYHEHIQQLQKYSYIPNIPLNPYKTSIDIAKQWIDYDKNTYLIDSEQVIYNQALKESEEGPCCCQCWHYYVNKGVAKKMIKEYQANSKDIADFWNLSDICGV